MDFRFVAVTIKNRNKTDVNRKKRDDALEIMANEKSMLLQLVRHKMPKGMDKYENKITEAELKDYKQYENVKREKEQKW